MINSSFEIVQKSPQPRIAIIGGGIAGCIIAFFLSNFFEVSVYETESSLLKGVSDRWWLRIHTGVHFPHEPERGILTACCSYAAVPFYRDFLLKTKKPQYYCAKDSQDQLIVDGQLLTPDRFIDYIKLLEDSTFKFKNKFPKGVELLGEKLWDFTNPDEPNFPKSAGIGVNTNEGVIDLPKLTKSFRIRLQDNPSVNINLQVEIKSIKQEPSGKYALTTSDGQQYICDYIINTTRHLPVNRIDKNFRQSHEFKLPTKMERPELRLYSVVEDVNKKVGPCHQYVHGNKGISYAYLPQSNKAIIEALPHTILKYGQDNDELLTWLELLSKDGPINQPRYRYVANKIFDLAQQEYPAFAHARLKDYFAAPMIQPSATEHDEMLKLLLGTPGGGTQIDPTGYFLFRNLKVTDTVICAFHILQKLATIHTEFGLTREAETKTPAEFGYWLMDNYPEQFVLKAINDSDYILKPSSRASVESYC